MSRVKLIAILVVIALLAYALFVFDVPYRKAPDASVQSANQVADQMAEATVTSPQSDAAISSPVTVTGAADHTWYFEANIPVDVIGYDGRVLGSVGGKALSDWTAPGLVPFTATVSFAAGTNTAGFIRVGKDNPSGLPQNEAYIYIPVNFKR